MIGLGGWTGVLMMASAAVFAQQTPPVSAGASASADVAASVVKGSSETNRESVITAKRIEFDNKEGVILFDDDVVVDDAQFLMRSDRLLVFTEGTNDVQQVMAIGHVSITNDNRSASCEKAVYTKKDGRIVMTGNAYLKQDGKGAADVGPAERIVFWLDDERMEVSPGRVVLPPGSFGKGEKKFLP